MSGRKFVDAPVSIMEVLDAALAAVDADPRFGSVPNGRIGIAWRQPSKGRNGDDDRPARYAVNFECLFYPDRTSRAGSPQEPPQ